MPTARTLARGPSFGASEARDVSLFGFVAEIVNILAIFPQRHALIVVSAIVVGAHAMRMADEERSNLLLHTEVDYLACGFVPQITDAPLCTTALLVFRPLQLLPSARILLAAGLLFGKLSQVSVALPFERADTPPGHDHGSTGIGRRRRQVDFSQIDRRMNRTGCLFLLWGLNPHVQFKAVIPDQRTRSTVFREGKRQNQGSTAPAHRQDHSCAFTYDSLRRPGNRIETLLSPGVLHPHLGMLLTQEARGFNVGKKGMHDHLHRLAMQGKPSSGGFLQHITSRPLLMAETGRLVRFHTHIPHLCGFHLESLQAFELRIGQTMQLVDFDGLHVYNSSMKENSLQVGKTRYTHYTIAYHLVWLPKYRRRILSGEVQKETKRLIQECCEQQGLTLLAVETDEDHIHVFVSAPPRFSPALIANHLKGYSSRFLRAKFPHLKKICGKEHLWTSSYYVGTAGNVSAETIRRYLMECQGK